MTDEQRNQAFLEMLSHDQEQEESKTKCLDVVKANTTTELYKDIIHYVQECDFTDRFEITTSEPRKEYLQSEGYDFLKKAWVNQTSNGGYSGDSFAGVVWLEISPKKWLKFNYSM